MPLRRAAYWSAGACFLWGTVAAFLLSSPQAQMTGRQAGQIQKPSGAAQARTAPQAAPLHSTTRMVQVSVVVHDKHGYPITGLTKDSFVILDDKKPQTIQEFSVETSMPAERPAVKLPPDTYTNLVEETSPSHEVITMILLDGLNTKFENQSQARTQVIQFLKTIQPQDHVAIYSLARDLKVLQDFTTDSASLLASLAKYEGEYTPLLEASTAEVADTGNNATDEFLDNAFQFEANMAVRDRVLRTVDALIQISNHVAMLPGRKNLIWLSGSFPFSLEYVNNDRVDDPSVTRLPVDQEFFGEEVQKAGRALTAANIAIYPVDARGLIAGDLGNQAQEPNPFGGSAIARQQLRASRSSGPLAMADPETFVTMDLLAGETGGKAYYNTNDLLESVRKAIDDSRVTYELGYYPEGVNWNGSYHTIKVEVNRPDARVRSREGYYALPEPKLTPQDRKELIANTAASPLDATQIGVIANVTGYSLAGGRTIDLAIAINPREFRFEERDGKWSDDVDGVYVELDGTGQIVHVLDETYKLSFADARYHDLMNEGIRYPKKVPIAEKAVQLRVIIRDGATGKIGDTTVPLKKYFPSN
jgi:VWFA-related protein